jgi:hypothetical protein
MGKTTFSAKAVSVTVDGEFEAQKANVPSVPQPLSVKAAVAASDSPVAWQRDLNNAVLSTMVAL